MAYALHRWPYTLHGWPYTLHHWRFTFQDCPYTHPERTLATAELALQLLWEDTRLCRSGPPLTVRGWLTLLDRTDPTLTVRGWLHSSASPVEPALQRQGLSRRPHGCWNKVRRVFISSVSVYMLSGDTASLGGHSYRIFYMLSGDTASLGGDTASLHQHLFKCCPVIPLHLEVIHIEYFILNQDFF